MNETKRERYIRILSGLGGADISGEACRELVELLKEQPERLTGHWIHVGDGYADYCKCSECGNLSDYEENFCCECGADMRGEQDAD